MSDLGQTAKQAQGKQGAASKTAFHSIAKGAPATQCGVAGLLRPRDRRIGRAVKMLDVLTSSDEALHAYLTQQQPQALQTVEDARLDMEQAETPEEAADFAPEPLDELLATPVPALESADFQALKDALLAECRNTITAFALPEAAVAAETTEAGTSLDTSVEAWAALSRPPKPKLLLSSCSIPGCCIHSVTPDGGTIIHHYTPVELTTPALQKASRLLNGNGAIYYVEIHNDTTVIAVDSRGVATEHDA